MTVKRAAHPKERLDLLLDGGLGVQRAGEVGVRGPVNNRVVLPSSAMTLSTRSRWAGRAAIGVRGAPCSFSMGSASKVKAEPLHSEGN